MDRCNRGKESVILIPRDAGSNRKMGSHMSAKTTEIIVAVKEVEVSCLS